ncbi:MAG: cbb3-type cytochrome c oxidase N-terminal domain-containing protein [Saprospiraceae bacterium]
MIKRTQFLKRITIYLLAILFPFSAAIAAVDNVTPGGFAHRLGDMFLIFGLVFVIAVLAFLCNLVFQFLQIQKQRIYEEQGMEMEPIDDTSIFEKTYDWLVGLKPMEQEKDIMLDHNYDGIQELDNNLPPWWLAMFYITVVMGVSYFAYYHYYDYGMSSHEEYAQEMEVAKAAQARFLEKQANLVNENNVTALEDPQALAGGKNIYDTKCASCHGVFGEGLVGPNLTDDYWLHGGDIKSVFKTVKHGVPQKGMIAWKTQINPASIHQVSSYIMTLHGTNPANPKEAQGDLYTPVSGE